MAFEQLNPKKDPRRQYGVRLSVRTHPQNGMLVLLRIGSDVLDRLDWRKGDRILAERGTGKDAGKLKLRKGDITGWALIQSGRDRTARLQISPLSDGHIHPAEHCEHRISNGALYVTLPKWANGTE